MDLVQTDQVIAKLGLDRSAQFTLLHREASLIKLGNHLSLAEIAQVTALHAGGTGAVLLGSFLKGDLPCLNLREKIVGLGLVGHQDVAGVDGLLGAEIVGILRIVRLDLLLGNAHGGQRFADRIIDKQIVLHLGQLRFEFRLTLQQIAGSIQQNQFLLDQLIQNDAASFGRIVIFAALAEGCHHSIHFRLGHIQVTHSGENSGFIHDINSFRLLFFIRFPAEIPAQGEITLLIHPHNVHKGNGLRLAEQDGAAGTIQIFLIHTHRSTGHRNRGAGSTQFLHPSGQMGTDLLYGQRDTAVEDFRFQKTVFAVQIIQTAGRVRNGLMEQTGIPSQTVRIGQGMGLQVQPFGVLQNRIA